MHKGILIQIIQRYHNRQTTDKFRNQTIFQQILRHEALQKLVICFIQLALHLCTKANHLMPHAVLNDFFNAAEGTDFEMPVDELALNGLHNLYNSMAAGLSTSLLNIKKDVIRKALSDFQSVEHRLEYVDTINGIRYVNDSKATNVNSCWYALESMKTPVVLILGGKDKGNDYSEIEKFVTDKVSAIVCMGKDNEKIKTFFAGKVPVIADTHSIGDAVSEATRLAKSGDTVLLSPCCASFDLFKSYEDRGRQFKDEVRKLKK